MRMIMIHLFTKEIIRAKNISVMKNLILNTKLFPIRDTDVLLQIFVFFSIDLSLIYQENKYIIIEEI